MNILNRQSPIPLYYQVAQILRDQIRDGDLDKISGIPSERSLMQTYNVSRSTARKALGLLASEGLLRREQGRGNYILPESMAIHCRIDLVYEHFETIRQLGYEPSVKLLAEDNLIPNEYVKNALGLEENEQVLLLLKLFFADGHPAILSKAYLHKINAGKMFTFEETGNNYFDFLEKYLGERVEYFLADIIPIAARDDIAEHLECSDGTPLLLLEETCLDARQERVLQFEYAYYNPKFIRYRVLRKRRQF